ncbi:hypothetical protein TNCV_3193621 [Trichonephila clavipes]|nr:hypothetical protein TNCV_3193621 [Trichonephila clavipes]
MKDFESLKELIIAHKILQSLDCETASHIAVCQLKKLLRPQELAKQCDIYFWAKQKPVDQVPNDVRHHAMRKICSSSQEKRKCNSRKKYPKTKELLSSIWRDNTQMDEWRTDLRKTVEIPSPILRVTIL